MYRIPYENVSSTGLRNLCISFHNVFTFYMKLNIWPLYFVVLINLIGSLVANMIRQRKHYSFNIFKCFWYSNTILMAIILINTNMLKVVYSINEWLYFYIECSLLTIAWILHQWHSVFCLFVICYPPPITVYMLSVAIFFPEKIKGNTHTEKAKWIIWLIWAIVGQYTDKMTQKCVKNESFCPCSDTLWLKWVKWFTRGFQCINYRKNSQVVFILNLPW